MPVSGLPAASPASSRRKAKALNPQAAEFVPRNSANLQFCPKSRSVVIQPAEETTVSGFEEIPGELVTKILSRLDTKSAASCAQTCRHLCTVLKEVPVRLHLTSATEQRLCREIAWTKLTGVQRCFPGVVELDLSGSMVEDNHVLAALATLEHLQSLQLANCTKLTSSMISAALAYNLLSSLTSLNLQRCYQLDTTALTLLLTASAQPAASLTALAVSHLCLYDCPSVEKSLDSVQGQAPTDSSSATDSGTQPGPAAESAVTSEQPASTGACPRPLEPRTSALQILALHNCTKVSAEALQCLAAACPLLEMLLLGGCSFVPALNRAGNQASTAYQPRGPPQHWLQCMDIPVDSALVHSLVEPASRLPHLKLLELSHAPALTAAAVAADLAQQRNRVQVVNLCNTEGIQAMADVIAQAGAPGSTLAERQVQLAVTAATNCSSSTARHTPLHLAAADGRDADLQALLHMGARVDAMDRSGATPLFSACENGHAACVRSLLSLGSPPSRSNAVGEAPLYIAALKGHEACVEVLLAHLLGTGLPWMDKEMYGDGWTPLMAAAVADHVGIVMRLLSAAGPHAKAMTSHTNRNGLTAAHVAARRGCLPVLHSLLAVGGSAIAATHDHACKTPIEIAERNGRWAAAALLRAAVQAH